MHFQQFVESLYQAFIENAMRFWDAFIRFVFLWQAAPTSQKPTHLWCCLLWHILVNSSMFLSTT